MKKLLSLALAILMIAALSTTAFAAVTNDGSEPTSIDVKAKYDGGVSTPDVISVDVTWGAMEFTYSVSGTKNWNASNHTYTDNSNATWTPEGNKVTVTNHSNVDVTAGFVYNAVESSSVAGSFDVESKVLEAGVVGGYDRADMVVSTLTLSGSVDASVTDFTKVGSIAVSIAKAN